MSSDESTSTNLSTTTNQNDTRKVLRQDHKSEEWEINLIGDLLLNLYHRSKLNSTKDWCVQKSIVCEEYSKFLSAEQREKLKNINGTDDIGTILYRCGFLFNTSRNSTFYKIKNKSLFDFRNEKVRKLDNLKINSDSRSNNEQNSNWIFENNPIVVEEENLDIDKTQPKIPLVYQGTKLEKRVKDFCPTNVSCYICQEDFLNMDLFEEHIETHSDATDFEFLNSLDKFDSPIFTMSYRLCKNSHNFCFELETNLENIIIERIIIVQTRSFFYVHNMRVPYKCPENGKDYFFVDSHLFTIHMEQPIILIYHLEDSKDSRIVEQHHFMRSEEFPKVNFSINPCRLPNKKLFKPKFQLPDYFPPKEIQDALKDDFYYEKLMKTSNEFRDYVRNGKNLQPQNIGASLNILLQIEDMDTIKQYLNLTQKDIKIRSYGDEYSFHLKPKKRIFLENVLTNYDEVVLTTRTDIFTKTEEIMELILKNKSDISRMENTFVGVIQSVNTGRISFKCDKKVNIHHTYIVICRPSRLNLRFQYRTLHLLPDNMNFLMKFLFPAKIIPKPLSTISLNLYNKFINGEQLQAVRNIAEGPRNDATYIIFGPPGTGKTTTIVESILQILKKPDTKVLVTASSNSACDEIAIRLCKYLSKLDMTRGMVRIYSRSCEVRTETIDDELLEHSNMYNGQFYPDIEILHEYRVVICTLSVVAKLATGKFGRNEYSDGTLYTHLFIDEVAASMEAEALIAMTTILTSKSCLIISGDHKQLGPILHSKRAEELGLASSLMDRLLVRDCYRVNVDSGDYDRTIQTRLVRNYRSHPAIVNLFSGLYYNHSLEAFAKSEDISLCEIWHKSRSIEYPITFHAIYEPSQSDKQSHSLYNLRELNVVMDYVKDLMYFGINGQPVKENDIGIISPYKKQYKRIQEELNLRKWFGIETGSVETFQGKEKNIIIVSFVRSGTESLGFLDSSRRLNVTISRAKSLLILIGNPKTLSLNSEFDYIIKECQRNKTFIGSNATFKDGQIEQSTENLTKTMTKLSIENADAPNTRRHRRRGRGVNFKNYNQSQQSGGTGQQQQTGDMPKKNRRRGARGERNKGDTKRNQKTKDQNSNKYDDDDDNDDNKSLIPIKDTSSKTDLEKDIRKSNNNFTAKSGRISKQYSKGGQNHVNAKNKIDSIFNELPKVPSPTTFKPEPPYTSDQLLQIQDQTRFYSNLQQNGYFNAQPPVFGFNQPARPTYNSFMHPQQQPQHNQSFNPLVYHQPSFQFPIMSGHKIPTTIYSNNFSSINNNMNNICQANKQKDVTAGTSKIEEKKVDEKPGSIKNIKTISKIGANSKSLKTNNSNGKNNSPKPTTSNDQSNKTPKTITSVNITKGHYNNNRNKAPATLNSNKFISANTKPLSSSSGAVSKKNHDEQTKFLHTSVATINVSKKEPTPSTTINTNHRYVEAANSSNNIYPVLVDPLNTFSVNSSTSTSSSNSTSGNNPGNAFPTNSFTTTSSPSTSTATNRALNCNSTINSNRIKNLNNKAGVNTKQIGGKDCAIS